MPVKHRNRKVTLGQILALGLFISGLIFCISGGYSLLYALGFGVICFSAHARSVGIPLPDTGAWTGLLIAAMLDIPKKKSIPAVVLGVCLAAALMGALSLVFEGLFF